MRKLSDAEFAELLADTERVGMEIIRMAKKWDMDELELTPTQELLWQTSKDKIEKLMDEAGNENDHS